MLNIGLKVSSWRYKHSLRRCAAGRDGKQQAAQNHARTPPNASFVDGVATKDCTIDLTSSLSIRIFLPSHCLGSEASGPNRGFGWLPDRAATATAAAEENADSRSHFLEAASDASSVGSSNGSSECEKLEDVLKFTGGYQPKKELPKLKLPVIVQFHDGGFVSGSKDSASNDVFCRRIAKACRSIVIAVGYRLAPQFKFPAARDDGILTLRWLEKQANLATFSSSTVTPGIFDSLGHMLVDPWISAHVDFSRCSLLGIGAGASIADQVSRSIRTFKFEPLQVISQVLLCPLFGGSTLLQSEIDLAGAYFMDRETLSLVWSCALPEGHNLLADHPAVDPLQSNLAKMPSTLVISAEQDMLRDRAAAYVGALKESRVDASLVIYRNAVHGFATMDFFMNTKLAQACIEDIAIWFEKRCKLLGAQKGLI